MKSKVSQALKEFQTEVKKVFPSATIKVFPPVADEDKLIEVILPRVSRDDREKIITIQSEVEWKHHVTFAVIPMRQDQAAA